MVPAGEALGLESFRFDVIAGTEATGLQRRSLEWKRKRPGKGNSVHIQTLSKGEYSVSAGRIMFGTLHLEWLQENGVFEPHQHALGRILADALAQAICTVRGLAPISEPEGVRL